MNGSVSTLPMSEKMGEQEKSEDTNVDVDVDDEDGKKMNRHKRYGVVDRRQQRQNHRSQASAGEQRSLLAEKDDSDLEQNIGRLCQYLSGSEDGDDEDRLDNRSSTTTNGTNLQRPIGLFLLNSRHHQTPPSNNIQQKKSADSATSSSLVSADENFNSTSPPPLIDSGMPNQHQQQQSQSENNFAQIIPMQRLVPRDFLNIPPPAQPPPPDESPCIDRPLPPQRTLPPLPDEPLYEEAKPAPPPPMPRPSKQQTSMQMLHKNGPLSNRTPTSTSSTGKASAVVSPVMSTSYHAQQSHQQQRAVDLDEMSAKPLCLSQGCQYNDIDWHNYETSVLERNEAGSFYIPSGQTTMSSISPSRKSEIDQQKHNNYLLSPTSAQTTIPVPVLPTRQEPNGPSSRLRQHPLHSKTTKMQTAFSGKRGSSSCCTWRCMTYSLAATLVFVLAVLFYLLHTIFTSSPLNTTQSSSSNQPPISPFGGSSQQFGYSTYSTATIEMTLRPVPESFALGDDVLADLIPGQLAHTYFTLQRNSYVQFNVSVDPQTKLAFYGRQTLAASPTQYDFVQIVQGVKFQTRRFDNGRRMRRGIQDLKRLPENLRSTTFVQYLSGGRWHLSILNDDVEIRTVRFSASLTDSEKEECKNNCHNKGVCKEGKCYCFDGFTGTYCEETFCPVLCSGNGIFASGKCHCHHGWKGNDCDVPSNVCEVPNCNGHGQCNNKGECLCDKGYKGAFCDQRECPHENCTGHGVCSNGKCYCDFGYKGEKCDTVYTSEGLCPMSAIGTGQCNGRGHLDTISGQCNCENGWIGENCEKKLCHMNCGKYGKCINDACVCDQGYAGDRCDQLACAPGCDENGRCSNGSCLCNEGWNGENCQLAGCPNACHRKGECRKTNNLWRCICPKDYGGDDCSVPLEHQCSDNVDNDLDGLVDCEDSDCCSHMNCQNDQYCRTVPDPYQVLVRKQSAPPQASFFQKTAFLLDSDSVQQYPDATLFNESRVSVIRGRVVNAKGGALMAVRIANAANALFGFTLSRTGGYFDLVVDGGGAITLQFMRKPFLTHYTTVVVPWNQIVFIGNIILTSKDDSTINKENTDRWSSNCLNILKQHDIKPYAVPSWKYGRKGATSSASGIIADAAAVQESLRIPGTDIFLTYVSANANGRESTLSLYLVGETSPKNLRLVRLIVDVEGVHFETTLEAKANLTYVYGWNKRNVYKQQVSGLAGAKVSVGYVYANCERVFWETMNVKLNGHSGSISEIGGWNLNIHHRYNILDSVLEKGDGGQIYLREELSVLINSIGTKEQRQLTCSSSSCNGPVSSAQLYLPMAVASSRDGSLYVGDYNLIRRWANNNNLITVLELSISDTAHRYYLAVHPISGEVYVSLPLRRQIWKIRNLSPMAADLTTNYDVVVGSGDICSVDSDCGDGSSADLASLTYPKGIAFDAHGNLYIADDRRIRLVSTNTLMSTVVGPSSTSDHVSSSNWQPLSCSTIFTARSFRPQWPTSLTFDYYSSSLLFLDTDVIFELTTGSNFVQIRAGAPSHCSQLTNPRNETSRPTLLKGATSIAATDDGRILVTETDRKRMHRIRSFDRYGRANILAGAESKCDCHRRHCPCDDENGWGVPAREAHLHNPTSIAVDQSGNVHVADEGNHKIRTLKYAVPILDPSTRLYEIVAADSQEIYYFNRFGQHVSTKDMLTDRFIYNFTYHVDTSYGKLNHVIGAGGHKLFIIRKSSSKIFIENTNGLKSTAYINQMDGTTVLEKFVSPTGAETNFNYETNTGLLTSKLDSTRRAWFYEYDQHGRLIRTILPTGDVLLLTYGLVGDRLLVDVKNEKGLDWRLVVSNSELKVKGESRERSMFMPGDSVYHIYTHDDVSVQYDGGVPSLSDSSTTILRRKITLPATIEPPRPSKTSKLEWRYYVKKSGRNSYKRIAQVNGVNVLTVEYDREKNIDLISNQNNEKILTVSYNAAGFVTQWTSASSNVGVMNITYDSMGRIINHNWSSIGRSYSYDRAGRLIEIGDLSSDSLKKVKKLNYNGENSLPSAIELPSGARYQIRYDQWGNLANLTSPIGLTQIYHQQNEMGSTSLFYYRTNNSRPNILSRNLDGTPIASYFGQGGKRVAYFYEPTSKLSKIIYDRSEITFDYHPKAGHLSSVKSMDDERTRSEIKYGYQGNLLVEILDSRFIIDADQKSMTPTTTAHWFYQYDDRLRLTQIQSVFDETTSQSHKIEYDSSNGRVISMNGYQFQYTENKIRMQNERSGVETTLTPNMVVGQTKFTIKGRTISEQRIFYDHVGRMISSTMKTDGDQGGVNYEYDLDGRLVSAKLSSGGVDHTWTYGYNLDGSLDKVNDVQLIYDEENNYLQQYGKMKYETDANGFIIRRGDSENFDYDSFGRLIRAWQDGIYDNRYFYDHSNRLITVERSKKNNWHFYYALLNRPNLITHAYDTSKRTQIVFTYDQNDRLISMETNGVYYFIITHPNGTPMHVLSDDGSLIKTILRSPFGVLTVDTAPDFVLFIGQKGRYQDLENGLIISERGRPSDPNVARYLSATVESFFDVNIYRLESTSDPFLIDTKNMINDLTNFDLDVNDWLKFNGYGVEDVIPLLTAANSPTFTCGSHGFLYISSECWLQKKIASFHTLLSVTRSPLLPETPFDRRIATTFASIKSIYGDGVVVANRSNLANVFTLESMEKSSMAALLNQSIILPFVEVKNNIGRYFWNKNLDKATSDWTKIGNWKDQFTSTFNSITIKDGSIRKEITILSKTEWIKIRYGGEQIKKEMEYLLEEILSNKESEIFWTVEKEKVDRNLNSIWNEREKMELKEKGRVNGFKLEYRRDPLSSPALSMDPNNIKFIKRTHKR